MANEATIRTRLEVKVANLDYRSTPVQFEADVQSAKPKGPTPGNVLIPVDGTDIDLSELDTPGLCRIMNVDGTNYVQFGIWDGSTFFPLGEVLPGETYVLRLARNLGEEYGTGTGTTGAAINKLRFKADTAAVNVIVDAFNR